MAFIPYRSKNLEALKSFTKYCLEHPEERFWQALRNWSRYNFVLVSDAPPLDYCQFIDTFSFEGVRHDGKEI